MAHHIAELIFQVGAFALQGATVYLEASDASKRNAQKRSQLQLPSSKYPRAVLTASSTITFGNDCERLVNIAFQTSQSFPSMMGTCADISEYIRKELAKHYPTEHFHIIIGKNGEFGFSVADSEYYAEIEQADYRVLIFASKQNPTIKSDTHDANSRMALPWN